jgi:hypothetical protein
MGGGSGATRVRVALTIALVFGAACDDGQLAHDGGAGYAPLETGGSGGRSAGAGGAGGARASSGGSGGGMHMAAGTGGARGATDAGPETPRRDAATEMGLDGGCFDGGCDAGGSNTAMKPFKGVANSPCDVREKLGVSWYYNWEQAEHEACADGGGGDFVPMIWGHTGAEQTASGIASAVASFASAGYPYVLGFNEPDNASQSNIAVSKAIALWPAFAGAMIDVVSPGTAANANPGQAWFSDFMDEIKADADLRVDVIALHWYGWNAGSCDAKAAGLENYIKWAEAFPGNRPIWLTEWGCLNQSAPDEATVVAFYKGALEVFAKHPRVERYAWYPWATNCHLADDAGELTALGKAYAAAPAYR